jgi:hypothetical protein
MKSNLGSSVDLRCDRPNNIMHPTRHKGIGSTKRFLGRVMMSVRLTEGNRMPLLSDPPIQR